MTHAALGLVLGAAFVHATWNLLAKRVAGGPAFVWLFSVLSAACAMVVGVGALAAG